jgi:hypothetical protein
MRDAEEDGKTSDGGRARSGPGEGGIADSIGDGGEIANTGAAIRPVEFMVRRACSRA